MIVAWGPSSCPPSRYKTEHKTAFNEIFFAISKRLNNANSLPRVLYSLAFQQTRKVIPVVDVIAVDMILYSIDPRLTPPLCTCFVGRTDFFEMSLLGSDFGRRFLPHVQV